jgi:hypothetical protein
LLILGAASLFTGGAEIDVLALALAAGAAVDPIIE